MTITEWQIYWADFDHSLADEEVPWPPAAPTEKPFDWWRTNNARLVDNLCHGHHRLWLFTSGKLCGFHDKPEIYQTFWPQVFLVEKCDKNPYHNNPTDPTWFWKYRIWVREEGCLAIDPPLLVEDIIFPFPAREFPPSKGQTVGERLQTPRNLDSRTLRKLRERLKAERGLEFV